MRNFKSLVLIPAVLFAVACGRDTSAKDVDAALDSDLRLAGQSNMSAMDSVSLLEREAQLRAANAGTNNVTTAPRRTTTTPRRATSSRSSGSGTYSAPAPRTQRTVTERNTARDAAIGAAAGAVIGATTSRDKVKGGIIGAVIGGTAGAVIGHNVDKKKRPVP